MWLLLQGVLLQLVVVAFPSAQGIEMTFIDAVSFRSIGASCVWGFQVLGFGCVPSEDWSLPHGQWQQHVQ
jgi:hypothetical protein